MGNEHSNDSQNNQPAKPKEMTTDSQNNNNNNSKASEPETNKQAFKAQDIGKTENASSNELENTSDAVDTDQATDVTTIKQEFKVYAGIDFGTDGTGLSYALPTGEVYIHQSWKGYKRSVQLKPKTNILLDANGKFLAFGQHARNSYITMGGEQTGWMLFEGFKMALYDNTFNQQLTAINGKKIASDIVFIEALKYIKSQIFKFFTKNKLQIENVDDVQWILTVPAIWSEKAKYKMEEWAVNAGLINKNISNHLKIVYEPDCASLSIQDEIKLNQNKKYWLNNAKYILIDAGGGTCDIACHRIINNLNVCGVAEVVHPTGGPWGSRYIDEYFVNLLHEIFSKEWIDEFKSTDPAAYTELIDNFCAAKHEFWKEFEEKDNEYKYVSDMSMEEKIKIYANKWHYIHLPFDFVTFLQDKEQNIDDDDIETLVKKTEVLNNTGFILLEDEYLKLNYIVWTTQLFDLVIDPIINHCKYLLSSTAMKDTTNHICLVGGLGSSKYLQFRISSSFGRSSKYGLNFFVPLRPLLSVVEGAAKFGLHPNYIRARILAKTYGNAVNPKINLIDVDALPPGYLEANQYRCDHSNVLRVRNIFNVYVRKNQSIDINDKPIIRKYKRFNVKLEKARIPIYASNEEDPKVVTNNKPIAKCIVVFPSDSTKLSIIVEIYFIDTKIRVFAYSEDNPSNKKEMELEYETGYEYSMNDDMKQQTMKSIYNDNDDDDDMDKNAITMQLMKMELGSKEKCVKALEAVNYKNINEAIEWLLNNKDIESKENINRKQCDEKKEEEKETMKPQKQKDEDHK